MRIINSYNDYINESNFNLLLEANIQYLPKFKNILTKIDSRISKELLKLVDTDVDVNTNYIDSNFNKNFINFYPDDRLGKVHYTLFSNDDNFDISYRIGQISDFSYDFDGKFSRPNDGTICNIIKTFTIDEVLEMFKPIDIEKYFREIYNNGDKLVHIRWGGNLNTIVLKSSLIPNLEKYKTMEFKIGKFTSSILKKAGVEFTNVELEDFVNKYKAQIEIYQNSFEKFKIVKGTDIRKYYLSSNYASQSGSLGSSCMKHRKCQSYFDIYVQNSNVSMIILEGDDGGIKGRALLWKDIKDRNVMDRIYVNNSADEELFKEYAKMNGYYHKLEQDYYSNCRLVFNGKILDSDSEDNIINVQLDERGIDYDFYPYMDTLKYINIHDGILSNNDDDDYDYELESTDGYHECRSCYGNGRVQCPECEGGGSVECDSCEGEGSENCDFCKGMGTAHCPECDGDDNDCEFCHGKPVECPECEGYATQRCDKCSGNGRMDCYFCDGYGKTDCPECSNN